MMKLLGSSLAAIAAFTATAASAQTVDFETTPSGVFAEGTTIGGITFTSALGSGMQVGNFGSQGNGQTLAVFDDINGNFLRGAIAGGATSLSFSFGNDDPFFTNAGDLAWLQVFNGATLVNTVTVLLNRDDIMNQSIGYSGVFFDNFAFAYADALGNPFTGGGGTNVGLTELVDDFRFSSGAVPEPGTWALLALGFGVIGGAMRSRRRLSSAFA